MSLDVRLIDAREWAACAADAHKAVFSERLPPEYDRIDFAILSYDREREEALGYMTCRELSSDDVYLRHGGAFPPGRGVRAYRGYQAALRLLFERGFKRITTLVENTNGGYLKMALTLGFKPIGIRNYKGSILVELFLEKE